MNSGKMVFSQIMDGLPGWRFRSTVKQYRGNHKSKLFSCADHFRVMAFSQLTHLKSHRDVEAAFDAIAKNAYHMGIKYKIAKSTLADANEQRNWKIYADVSRVLIAQARKLYADDPLDVQWDDAVYAIDATTIDLGLFGFLWEKFRRTKAAIKLQTKRNLRGNIPGFIHISNCKLNAVNALDLIVPEPGAFYLFDRAYTDFQKRYFNNQIEDIVPLAGLIDLQALYLYNNQIDGIAPLAGLTDLQILDLYNNQIEGIAPLTDLQELFFCNNRVSDISALNKLTGLQELALENNNRLNTVVLCEDVP